MVSCRMLLFVDPPKYGRSAAGVSWAASTHHPAPTTMPTPASTSCHSRRPHPAGPAHRYATANPGATRKACSILARNANPSSSPHRNSHRLRPFSTARTSAYAANVISSTSSASGLLNRNISAATGVSASTAPAISPATGPDQRRTAAYSSPTDATPSRACGSSMDHWLKPNIRPDSSITHSDPGVLSTVMKLDESNDPKKNAFQLWVPACTAAA